MGIEQVCVGVGLVARAKWKEIDEKYENEKTKKKKKQIQKPLAQTEIKTNNIIIVKRKRNFLRFVYFALYALLISLAINK